MRAMKASTFAVVGLMLAIPSLRLHAAGTNALTPSASVTGQCKVTVAPGTLNFGAIDPSGAANVSATTTFSMKCTKGTISTAASDNGGSNFSGTKRMKHSATPTAFLPYAVAYGGDTGFTGQGFGVAAAAQTVTVTGTITPAQFQNALVTKAGQQYSDTVTITVNP
jgi:spore coat protein U-like protein